MVLEFETIAVGGFGSFEEMQKAHLALMRALRPDRQSETAPSGVREIATFVARAKKTGAVLAKETERQAAQNILDYWSVDTISFSDINEKEWAPPKLAPFNQGEADGATSDSISTADEEAAAWKRRQARKQIRLAATARLWRDAGRPSGYLLQGTALKDASAFAAFDPDIAELVKASESRKIRIQILLLAAIIIFFTTALSQFLYATYKQAQIAMLEAQQMAMRSDQTVLRSDADVQSLVAKIKELEKQLSVRNVGMPTEFSEMVPDTVLTAAMKGDGGSPIARPQRGYLWLGSDQLPNLQIPTTLTLVKPSAATVGSSYTVNKNLILRTGLPSLPDYVQTASAGVVPEQTVVTLRSAPQPYMRPTLASLLNPKSGPAPAGAPAVSPTTNQFWAQVEVQPSDKPIVYVEYATGGAAVAQPFVQKLKALGYRIPGVESTDLAKGLNEIRYYYAADKTPAEKLVADIKAMGPQGAVPIHVVDLTTKAGSRNFPGVVELWTDLSGTAQ